MRRERDIILKLNESRNSESEFDDAGQVITPRDYRTNVVKGAALVARPEDGIGLNTYEEDYLEDDELVYACPECGEEFESDEPLDVCICPYCDAEIAPEYIGTEDELDDDDMTVADPYDEDPYDPYEECDDYDEDCDPDRNLQELKKKTVIRHGKKVKKVVGKKGYKVVDGKLVKMSAKEKRARAKAGKKNIKKAQKKGKRMKAKSMKKAMALNNSLDLNFEEYSFMDLMNGVIGDVMENYGKYEGFKIVSINEATMSENDTDTLTVEATVQYDNGKTDTAEFMIEGLTSDDGTVEITEMNQIFNPYGLTVTGTLDETYNTVAISKMSYELRNRRLDLSESFQYVR